MTKQEYLAEVEMLAKRMATAAIFAHRSGFMSEQILEDRMSAIDNWKLNEAMKANEQEEQWKKFQSETF